MVPHFYPTPTMDSYWSRLLERDYGIVGTTEHLRDALRAPQTRPHPKDSAYVVFAYDDGMEGAVLADRVDLLPHLQEIHSDLRTQAIALGIWGDVENQVRTEQERA